MNAPDRPMTSWMERIAFYGLLVVSILPILLFGHFPAEDGPLHVANASVYLHHGTAPFIDYYDFELSPIPNLSADLVFAGLSPVASPAVAIRIVAALLALALPLALRWCIDALNPAMLWLSTLSIPLAQGRLLYLGYFSYQIGVVLTLVALGFWLRYVRGRPPGAWRWIGLGTLYLLIYFSHPIPLAVLVLLTVSVVIADRLDRTKANGDRRLWVQLGAVGSAIVVPAVLLIGFGRAQDFASTYLRGPLGRLVRFPGYPIVALSSYEVPVAGLFTLVWVGAAIYVLLRGGRRQRGASLGFLVAAAVLGVGFFVVPDIVGEGSDFLPRISVYIVLSVLLWMATRETSSRFRSWGLVAAAVVVVALAAVRLPSHQVLDEDIDEYLSGQAAIEPGSTVLPLWYSTVEAGDGPGGSGRVVRPLAELAGELTADGTVVDLHHFHASSGLVSFHFREGRDIRDTAGGELFSFPFIVGPAMVDVDAFEAMGGSVDYLYIWQGVEDEEAAQGRAYLAPLIEAEYELVFTSAPDGRLEVYRRIGS